jgi:hypothetical protein
MTTKKNPRFNWDVPDGPDPVAPIDQGTSGISGHQDGLDGLVDLADSPSASDPMRPSRQRHPNGRFRAAETGSYDAVGHYPEPPDWSQGPTYAQQIHDSQCRGKGCCSYPGLGLCGTTGNFYAGSED